MLVSVDCDSKSPQSFPAQWDEDLSEMAQAWADQCALVEYNSGGQQPKRLFHDARAKRED